MNVIIPTLEQVLAKVDDFLARHKMAETRLGREATGESSLISDMRGGRHPSLKTLNRLDAFMAEQDAELAASAGDASPTKEVQDIRTPGVVAAPKTTPFVAPSSSTSSTIPEPQASPTGRSSNGPASTEAEAA